MQVRIQKLKLTKQSYGATSASKMCNNCKKDFKDSENFNWSCRVHQSQWSGEMWWCCGKSTSNAPGCRFGMHVTNEDKEDAEGVKDPIE